jgi:hypothetical protein
MNYQMRINMTKIMITIIKVILIVMKRIIRRIVTVII